MNNSRDSKFFRLRIRPWGLLTAAGAVVCAATAGGFLGRFSWFLDLFSHFRVQYLIALGILGFIFLLGKRRKIALVFLFFSAVNIGAVLPLYFGGNSRTPQAAGILRAMLLNVNTRFGNPELVKKVILEYDPDILVLEEISSQWVKDLKWLAESRPHQCTQPREDNFGIGLFSKRPLLESKIIYIGDAEVPSIIARIDSSTSDICVIATHPLPPRNAEYTRARNNQLAAIPAHIPTNIPTILLGDLNVTSWNYNFIRLLRQSGLKDGSRGMGFQPTWPNFSPLFRIPIDHCLHSAEITVINKQIGPDVGSDHYPVIVDFVVKPKHIRRDFTGQGMRLPRPGDHLLKQTHPAYGTPPMEGIKD